MFIDDKTSNQITMTTSNGQKHVPKAVKCYYIDELGFYRHLDPDQRQYVCSNISSTNTHRREHLASGGVDRSTNGTSRVKLHQEEQKISAADGGYEICFRALRKDLGISHFDRIDDYDNWKRGWDEFMRVKLTSQLPVTLNRDLKNRVRSGIPHDYRRKVWSALIRMRTRAIRAQFGENIYETILRDFVNKFEVPTYSYSKEGSLENVSSISTKPLTPEEDGDGPQAAAVGSQKGASTQLLGAPMASHSPQKLAFLGPAIDKSFKQIELDLLRTLPNNRHFEDPNSRGVKRVRRVLRAYACFNQSVSYCQGMNRLAAMSLLVLPEDEAFWCLVAIIQCIMPKDYYVKPWLAQVDCCVLSDLLEKKMPKLHKHLVKNDIQLTLFSWFFTIFVDGFRPELMLRIWDCFLLEGDKVLFRIALAILHISQDDLLGMSDFSSMSAHLCRLVSTRQLDTERLFDTFNSMNPLSNATIRSKREFHRNKMQLTMDDH